MFRPNDETIELRSYKAHREESRMDQHNKDLVRAAFGVRCPVCMDSGGVCEFCCEMGFCDYCGQQYKGWERSCCCGPQENHLRAKRVASGE